MAERGAHALLRAAAAQGHPRLHKKRSLLYDVRARADSRRKQLLFGLYSTGPRRCPRARCPGELRLWLFHHFPSAAEAKTAVKILRRFFDVTWNFRQAHKILIKVKKDRWAQIRNWVKLRRVAVYWQSLTTSTTSHLTGAATNATWRPSCKIFELFFLKGAHELVQPLVERKARLPHSRSPRTGRRCDRADGAFLLFEVAVRVVFKVFLFKTEI